MSTEPVDGAAAGPVVMTGERSRLEYRNIREEWATMLEAIELSSFPTSDPAELSDAAQFAAMARDFPDGGFVGFDGDDAVAMGVGIRVDFDLDDPLHVYTDIMPTDGTSGHVPRGDWYYGSTIAVRPSHRRLGIGGELYELRKRVCRDHQLRGIVAGGVLPGFTEHKHDMSADEYIDAVRRGELTDPTLSFQLANGFEAVRALPNYLRNDKVDHYAVLIVWHNPDHRSA